MDRSMLNKATSADETPTPGYMYGEIAKSTFGDIQACQQLADYLLKKLERDNPHVKAKSLKIIRHVCEQGKGDFRRAIQKKADLVKGCLQYRGTPDALKGDSFNKAVREEADAAVKSLFASDSSTNAYGMSNDTGKKMQGFGSDSAGNQGSFSGGGGGSSFGGPSNTYGGGGGGSNSSYGGGGGGSSQSAGGMVGFGNPNFNNAPKPDENTYASAAMKSATAAAGSMFAGLKSKVQSAAGQTPSGPSGGGNMESHTSSYRAPNMNMQSGGGFGSGVQGQWGSDRPQMGAPPSSGTGVTGEYEARVVNELCAPGGPRVAPSAQALEEFCRKCESLDASAMGKELRKKLEEQNWQTRLKALHAIEALYDKGLEGITGHVAQFSSELLFECQDMPQCKAKANRVLHILGFIEEPTESAPRQRAPASPAAAPAPTPAPAPTMDLLDMGFDDAPTTSPQAAPSLLGDLNVAAPAAAPVDMLGGPAPSMMPTEAPAPAAAGGGGLFGGLSVGGAAPAPAMQQPAAEPPSLLAGLQAANPPMQAAPADNGLSSLGGMFSGLSMGEPSGTSAPPAAAPEAAPAAAPGPMGGPTQDRSHLNVLAGGPMGPPGGGGPMGQPAMNGNPMMMQPGQMGQQGPMGMPMGQPGPMGMPMGQQPMGQGPMMGGMGMMNQGMMGQPNAMGNPMGMGMGMGPQGMGMGMGMPQMQQQPMGMGMGMGGQMPMGGYGGAPFPNANMGMPNAMGGPGMMAGPGMSGPPGGPGSAFGFIGGGGGLANAQAPMMGSSDMPSPAALKTESDSAFSFVTDEISRS